MGDMDVLERGWSCGTDGPGFDLVASKLRRPSLRPGTVWRWPLIRRLMRDASPIVSVVAPAGYGKTTLLAQWAEDDGQAFAWVSVGETDNDPRLLLSYVARALDAVQPIGEPVFEALASPVSSVPGSVVPRVAAAFASMTVPVVLVLDDVHLLRDRECQAALSVLADHVPDGSRLVLAGRPEPPLRVARLRAQGRVTEIGPPDLSLGREEAASLVRATGVVLSEDEVAVLHRRTEGWPAGLYLAALCLGEADLAEGAAMSFDGADRFVAEYVESEFLARISVREREFLTRTAVLERMSGPLCEAVLDRPGAAAALAGLARSNLLLVPLDRRGQWYRYHHLFRDMLLAELERTEPGLMPALRRRAARWCLGHGMPEEALEYSMAAGDIEQAARLVEEFSLLAYRQGRVTTVQRWLRWLDGQGSIDGYPMITVLASLLAAATGRPAEAERWADAVDRRSSAEPARPVGPSATAWAALLRALLCRHGAERMRADANEAARRFAAADITDPMPALGQGMACVLSGDLDDGDGFFRDAADAAAEAGAADSLAVALSQRSLVAMARGQWNRARALADQARAALRRTGRDGYPASLVCAVQARAALHQRDLPAARRELARAQRQRPLLTYAFPHLAVQTRIELTRVHLALADLAGARTLMREIDELLQRRPDLGALADEAAGLRARLSEDRGSHAPGASSLTTAELRILPRLATHLSFPEIAAELFLSRHTVRSQAMAVYRKLGVSSRSQAVTRSRELGLLEETTDVLSRPG